MPPIAVSDFMRCWASSFAKSRHQCSLYASYPALSRLYKQPVRVADSITIVPPQGKGYLFVILQLSRALLLAHNQTRRTRR